MNSRFDRLPEMNQLDLTRTPKFGSTQAPGVAGRALAASCLRVIGSKDGNDILCVRGGRAPFLFRNPGLMQKPRDLRGFK
jgi:hypothetical protein